MKKSAFFKVLKNKNFLKLWLSQVLSLSSAYLLNFVLMVRIYEATGSTTALGLFLLVYTAPSVFLGLFSGAFIDLWSKRKVLILTNMVQALVVLLYLGASDKIWPIYSIVFLYSICDEFYFPAQATSLPGLIKKDFLPVANTFFLFTNQGSIIIGSTLGSPVIRYLGKQAPFLIACLFLLIAALSVFLLPKDKPKKKPKENFNRQVQLIVADIKEGYRFIKKKPRVLYPFIFFIISQVLIGANIILFPSLAKQVLGIKPRDAGVAVLFPVGIGAVLGAIFITQKIKDWGRKILISIGWLIIGTCFLIISLVAPQVPIVLQFIFFILIFLGTGIVFVIITSLTMIQENTPEAIRGRVFGTLNAMAIISAYLPVMILAAITDRFGVTTTLLFTGVLAFLIGIISYKMERKYVLGASNWT